MWGGREKDARVWRRERERDGNGARLTGAKEKPGRRYSQWSDSYFFSSTYDGEVGVKRCLS